MECVELPDPLLHDGEGGVEPAHVEPRLLLQAPRLEQGVLCLGRGGRGHGQAHLLQRRALQQKRYTYKTSLPRNIPIIKRPTHEISQVTYNKTLTY
jgi:hypothetical protein